jgi:hypothetical protein
MLRTAIHVKCTELLASFRTSVSFRTGTGNAKNCYLCKMHRVDVTSVSFRTGREMSGLLAIQAITHESMSITKRSY